MSIAFMSIFDVHVIDRIWQFGPLDDITIRVLHRNNAMQLEEDEYILKVPVGATLGEIKEKLLDAEFRKFGWLYDGPMLWERAHQHIELSDKDDFEDDTTLCLRLFNKHYFQEASDEEVSEEEAEVEEEEESKDYAL
jgi:hypothetical protein